MIDALPAVGNDLGLRMDLLAALAKPPVEQRQPLLLVTLEQLSYAECAEVLRIPVGDDVAHPRARNDAARPARRSRAPPERARGLRRVV